MGALGRRFWVILLIGCEEPARVLECTTNTECGTGSICLENVCRQTCVLSVSCPDGQSCQQGFCADIQCQFDLECGTDICRDGQCQSPGQFGDLCDPEQDSDCGANLACPLGVCKKTTGNACIENDECAETCIAEICTSIATAGDPCDALDDNDCGLELECQNETCLVPLGSSCTHNNDCAEACIAGVCSAASTLGQCCDTLDANDCATGLVCTGNAASCPASSCLLGNAQTCTSDAQCDATCILGSCSDPSGLAGPCDTDADCHEDGVATLCTSGVCELAGGCNDNAQCPGQTCIGGACQNVAGIGEPCDIGDSGDCGALLTCSPSGLCQGNLGEICTQDAECESGHCECGDATCSSRLCLANDCVCKFGALCDSNLTAGTTDPEGDCDQPGMACNAGACRSASPGSCQCALNSLDPCNPVLSQSSCGSGWTPQCEQIPLDNGVCVIQLPNACFTTGVCACNCVAQ